METIQRLLLLVCVLGLGGPVHLAAAQPRPNIIYILADDLGYGDVKCLNPDGKIPTPNLDRLAAKGLIFTDAHSSSSVCTPTRYGILTGRYNWRSRLKSGVLNGYSPRLIEENRLTVAGMLKQNGYTTACIGKWHLGMDWAKKQDTAKGRKGDGWLYDYAAPIRNGPTAVGFDTFFGVSASLDMPPFVFIENDRCVDLPTVDKTWVRKGPAAKSFEAVEVLPVLQHKAEDYLAAHAGDAHGGHPIFLYLALTSPHTPILPGPSWQGKSRLNAYADFVMQTDAAVGRVMDALERTGLVTNTLVFFASDNGCSPQANFEELESKGHYPSYRFRGTKADIFDGGHRVPLIVSWPGKIQPGTVCDQLVCLVDFMSTCADILGVKLPPNSAEDSFSLLPLLLGRTHAPVREAVVHHSINGSFSIRQANWKLELCPDSGGWSDPRPGAAGNSHLPPVQLYDLSTDIAEKTNVQDKHPEVVRRLSGLLEKMVAEGRSTPGPAQSNTTPVRIWRTNSPRE